MNYFLALVVLLVQCLALPAVAQDTNDLGVRSPLYSVIYDVKDDASVTATYHWSKTVLKDNQLANARQASISFSTSVEKGEIVEAQTIKKSGKRVPVPASNYQVETNKGRGDGKPFYSDITTITVVFPDVEVGDTVEMTYKLVQTVAIFPGHVSLIESFSRYAANDEVLIKVSIPEKMWVQYEAYHLQEQPVQQADGRKTFEWRYSNKNPLKWRPEHRGITRLEDVPSLFFSTFKSYDDIAKAYGERAGPKVSERVLKLAQEITAGKTTPKQQMTALHRWVTQNISYAGNCIGIGAVVPRDLDTILDNKMGDCKDQSTLLQALLKAKGIASTQALVNSGDLYTLPKVPTVASVNHVILYIPSEKLFVDPTASDIPLGMLPIALGDKPTILVDNPPKVTQIPSTDFNKYTQVSKAKFKILPNATLQGTTEITTHGMFAVAARKSMADLKKDDEAELVKNYFRGGGYTATGTVKKNNPDDNSDPYTFSYQYEVTDYVQAKDSGALYLTPLFSGVAPLGTYLKAASAATTTKEQACAGGRSSEELEYEFPPKMKILSVPKDFEIKSQWLDFKAVYRLKGQTLKVSRSLHDKTQKNVCSAEHMNDYASKAIEVVQHLKSQVLFKW